MAYRWWRGLAIATMSFVVLVMIGASGYVAWDILKPIDPPLNYIQAAASPWAHKTLPEPSRVRIESDGFESEGLYFSQENSACAVIIHHGYTSHRYDSLRYAPMFWRWGCHLLLPDSRGHGSARGAMVTWGYREREDLNRWIDFVMEKTGLSLKNIGLMGESLGGAITIHTAARRPGLGFVATDSSYSTLLNIFTHRGSLIYGEPLTASLLSLARPWVALVGGFDPKDLSPLHDMAAISAPIFLLHSIQDDFTPVEHGRELAAAISHDRKMVYFTDWQARHAQSIHMKPVEYGRFMEQFLERYFPAGGHQKMGANIERAMTVKH